MRRNICVWSILLLVCVVIAACSTPHPITPQNAAPTTNSLPFSPPSPSPTPTPRPTPTTPPTISGTPKIIPHPKPDLSVDLQVLRDAGCAIDWGRSGGAWVCPNNAAMHALWCDTIAPDNLLAGFTPFYPVMRCETFKEPPDKEHFHCAGNKYAGYLLFKDGHYRLIATEAELRDLFAPVESADEALSFALVATNLTAKFELEHISGEYYAETIEGTHVEETPDGYVVHLFTQPTLPCDCGTHVTSMANVLVTREGHVKILNMQPAYGSSACIDCGISLCE